MDTAIEAPKISLLVLDVHGVVLSSPLPPFLAEVARLTEQSQGTVLERWHGELKGPAWLGELSEAELWRRLADGSGREAELRAGLEAHLHLGPAAAHLASWRRHVPVWLLSNHRSAWLEERLERFDLHQHFERVLVSDRLGAPKPEAAAFAPVLATGRDPREILFVDNQQRNVDAASGLGLTAILAREDQAWIDDVARLVSGADAESASVDDAFESD